MRADVVMNAAAAADFLTSPEPTCLGVETLGGDLRAHRELGPDGLRCVAVDALERTTSHDRDGFVRAFSGMRFRPLTTDDLGR